MVFAAGTGTVSASPAAISAQPPAGHADFAGEPASPAARQVADWVVASADNRGLTFVVVDKIEARLFLFDGSGTLRAGTPVLLGVARGDDSPPGIGSKKLAAIPPAERITPAGRFVAEPGKSLVGKDILWIDYDAAVSLHRAGDRKPGMTSRSRVERLASASVADRRVSFGCINVSSRFYDTEILPAFANTGIVYILPETRSAAAEFHIPVEIAAAPHIAATPAM